MNSNSPSSPKMLTSAERKTQALELRKAGATYKAIANALGVTERMAFKYVKQSIEHYVAVTKELTADVVELELQRLDDMLLAIAKPVKAGHLGSIDRALKIQERRARLLGIDKPEKIAPTNPEGDKPYYSINTNNLTLEELQILRKALNENIE